MRDKCKLTKSSQVEQLILHIRAVVKLIELRNWLDTLFWSVVSTVERSIASLFSFQLRAIGQLRGKARVDKRVVPSEIRAFLHLLQWQSSRWNHTYLKEDW